MEKRTVGFIGAGNMASAIIQGMVVSGEFSGEDIAVFDRDEIKMKHLQETLSVGIAKDNEQLIRNCGCIVLAVKPNALPELLKSVSETLKKEHTFVISIAAGQDTQRLQDMIGFPLPVVRVMPNVNALAGQAISGYTKNDLVNEQQLALAVKILNCFGKSVEIEEDKFSVFSAVAGCSPAYVYLFANTISALGVADGLTKAKSLETVCDEMIKQAKTVNDFDIKEERLYEIVRKALKAAYEKDTKI